jgi:hypothetical protein
LRAQLHEPTARLQAALLRHLPRRGLSG